MIQQVELMLRSHSKGFHLITDEVLRQLPRLPRVGILHLFVQHTSCGLAICENVDPYVRVDLDSIFNNLIKECEAYYKHTMEGDDDMPAHAKSVLVGVDLNIPITNGQLNLGMWQGIYLCEFRNYGGSRKLVATVLGEE